MEPRNAAEATSPCAVGAPSCGQHLRGESDHPAGCLGELVVAPYQAYLTWPLAPSGALGVLQPYRRPGA
eukprot:1187593-Prorocentrum_minimum.AAC.1